MTSFQELIGDLRRQPRRWLVTGAAGFIGSHLVEYLLGLDQHVVGIDNFSTGKRANLEDVEASVEANQWRRFRMLELDTAEDIDALRESFTGADYVLHQAALGSVPRSLIAPEASHRSNVTGFLNVLNAGRHASVRRIVYASSSSVYGDLPTLPKSEESVGKPLSPYAATKQMNEIYAGVYARAFGLSSVGLRYFNVFGPRQDPLGPYAAVIPQWIIAMLENQPAAINGDGSNSRDFCYIQNVVQANILAACAPLVSKHEVFNIALNARTSLIELFEMLRTGLVSSFPHLHSYRPLYRPERPGDIKHSQADIRKAQRELGYVPEVDVQHGVVAALDWYTRQYALKPGPRA